MSPLESLIERYAAGINALIHATSLLPPEKWRTRVAPGIWSIAEVVAHMIDSDLVDADRIKRVIAEDEPKLAAYDESLWLERLRSDQASVEDALALFTANRRWMLRILRACTEADFRRVGWHTERGRMTLAEIVVGNVSHLDHHLRFLYGKRANLGLSLQPLYSYPTL